MRLDEVINDIISNRVSEINTTMTCEVITVSPLTIKPVQAKKYADSDIQYDLIVTAKKLKQWGLVEGTPTAFTYPLTVGDKVLVAFGKHDLTNAVILGVIE